MKVVKGNVETAKQVAQYLRQKYAGLGYLVRAFCDVDAYVLQIRSDESGIGGACKGLTGLDKDIVVRIKPDGGYVYVEASGNYRGKLGRIGFGTFVAFGVVAVTAAIGSATQADMACAIESDAEEFLQNGACDMLPHTRVSHAIAV